MKRMKRLSLRMRITLLSGAILLVCSAVLTVGASYNAHSQLNAITLDGDPASYLVEGTLPGGRATLWAADGSGTAPQWTTAPALTEAKKQFDAANLAILAVVSVLGMAMVYLVAGRSLRPIHDLSETISAIGEENLQERIPEEERNDEVGALGHSFNVMLDRLEKSFLRQKQFAANAAHELKTPLATISAGIQVLRLEEHPAASDYEETLAAAERNVGRLTRVVDGLMSLYEQEEFSTSLVDLRGMFESILRELRPALDEKRIRTEFRCGLETVYGNPVLLYRACFNLVENAAKYNREDGSITIETGAAGRTGRIAVSDTGGGIPADELPRIFEPFYRVNKSRSRKTGGAGLGLSIVRAIVEKHGWKLSADSEPGRGSTFTITLAV